MRPLALLFAFVTVLGCSSSSDDNGTSSLPAGTVIDNCTRTPAEDSICRGDGMEQIPDSWRCTPKLPFTFDGTSKRKAGGRACIMTAQDDATSNLWCCTRLPK